MQSPEYENRKNYLNNNPEINKKWKSLISLWKNVTDELKKALNPEDFSDAVKRRIELTSKNIFDLINKENIKPDFSRHRKRIRNEEAQRNEYVIECNIPSSDYIFKKIKDERGVVSMLWNSINKYLQPITDEIWALKIAKDTSKPQSQDLSYEALKTKTPTTESNILQNSWNEEKSKTQEINETKTDSNNSTENIKKAEENKEDEEFIEEKESKKDEWAENHYCGNDDNIVNESWNVVPNEKKLNEEYNNFEEKKIIQDFETLEDNETKIKKPHKTKNFQNKISEDETIDWITYYTDENGQRWFKFPD